MGCTPANIRRVSGEAHTGAPSPLPFHTTADRAVPVPAGPAELNRTADTGLPGRPSGHRDTVPGGGQGGFAGSGSVGRYWQTRCRGFEVRSTHGRRLGRVEALELDRRTRATVVLVVRRRLRLVRMRPECVQAVDPWRRSLVVSLPQRRRIGVPAARRMGRGAGATAVRTAALSRTGLRVVVPRLGRALAWAMPRALLATGILVWIYALVVYTLVRVVVRLLVALTAGTARGGARLKPHLHARI